MYTKWRILTHTKTEAKARRVIEWLQTAMGEELLDVRIEPHHEHGHQVFFGIDHGDRSYAEAVLAAMECTEHIGGPWILGLVHPLNMYATKSSFNGVDLAEFWLQQSAEEHDGASM